MQRVIFFILLSFTLGAIDYPSHLQEAYRDLKDPATRTSHYPLITGDTFRRFCDLHVDETSTGFDPTSVQRSNTVFVGMEFLKFFLEKILPEIQHPFILVTSNGCGTIDPTYLPYLEEEKILHWFGRNIVIEHPKLTCIPLGVSWFPNVPRNVLESYFARLMQETYFSNKPIYCYLNIGNTIPSRPVVLDVFATKPFCSISKPKPFKTYMREMASSRFIISPRGFNIDCFRTWEALYAGSIPVVESLGINSIYEGLPVIIVEDLNAVTPEFLDAEFEKLKEKRFHLERLHAQYWLDKIQAMKNVYLQ